MSNVFGTEAAKDPLSVLCNIEAEQSLLGALLLNNKAFEHVVDIVAPEDFGHPSHARVYSAIAKLVSEGMPADPVTLLKMAEQDEVITPAYISSLVSATVSVINAPHYAKTIADLAQRRHLVTAAQDIIADAVVVDLDRPANTILDEAEERLNNIAERSDKKHTSAMLGDIVEKTLAQIEAAYKIGGAITVDTGLTDLDKIISGMGAGDLVVMAGRPSMGKSAAAGTFALNAARKKKMVLIFSLEMTQAEIAGRWIAGLTGISTDNQRHGKLLREDWEKLAEARRLLSLLPIIVDDGSRLSVGTMRHRSRRIKRRMKNLGLIIIDHLQLVRQGGKQESRRLEIGDATSALKAMAKELGVPVLVLSQLSRAPEQRPDKRPILADLRESGDIEQDADVVLFLYRDEYYLERAEPKRKPGQTQAAYADELAQWNDHMRDARGIAEISVAKNRHGRTGTVKVHFDAERQRFEDLARGY